MRILLIILILVGNALFAQNKELVFKVVKPNSGEIRVTPGYEYLIYGETSKISVTSNLKEIKFILEGGSVIIRESDTVIVAENMKGVTLYVYDFSNGNNKLVKTIDYKVMEAPTLYLGGKSISQCVLKRYDPRFFATKLDVRNVVDGNVTKYEVKSFSLGFTCNGDYKSFRIKGNRLSKKAIEYIESCRGLDRFYFEKIYFELSPNQILKAGVGVVKFQQFKNPVFKQY